MSQKQKIQHVLRSLKKHRKERRASEFLGELDRLLNLCAARGFWREGQEAAQEAVAAWNEGVFAMDDIFVLLHHISRFHSLAGQHATVVELCVAAASRFADFNAFQSAYRLLADAEEYAIEHKLPESLLHARESGASIALFEGDLAYAEKTFSLIRDQRLQLGLDLPVQLLTNLGTLQMKKGSFSSGVATFRKIIDSDAKAEVKVVALANCSACHSQNGDQSLDKQSIEIRGTDGHLENYRDTEKTTLQVDATTVRSTIRTFSQDVNGKRSLVQVTEEEKHILPGDGSNVGRVTYNPDADGRLQAVQREVVETKTISQDFQETNTTVMLPSAYGGLAPAFKTHETRTRAANETVNTEKTTWLPDLNGKWQLGEKRKNSATPEANGKRVEETVFRPDAEGKLRQISRVVSHESESSSGERRKIVEKYSVDFQERLVTVACTSLSATPLPVLQARPLREEPNRRLNRSIRAIPTLGSAFPCWSMASWYLGRRENSPSSLFGHAT